MSAAVCGGAPVVPAASRVCAGRHAVDRMLRRHATPPCHVAMPRRHATSRATCAPVGASCDVGPPCLWHELVVAQQHDRRAVEVLRLHLSRRWRGDRPPVSRRKLPHRKLPRRCTQRSVAGRLCSSRPVSTHGSTRWCPEYPGNPRRSRARVCVRDGECARLRTLLWAGSDECAS